MKKLFYHCLQFIFLLTVVFIFPPYSEAKTKNISVGSYVSVLLGSYQFKLFGYTSPQGYISLEGMGVSDSTYANQQGYFEFNNQYSPLAPRELCLTAQDQFGRLTTPICLPPFPVKYNLTIGPVILPPTLSLNKKDYFVGDEVILSGQTIPDKDITLSIFTKNKKGLIKPVEAFAFPKLKTKTDHQGNFSFSLPSSSSKKYRIFTQVHYNEDFSPKSLILNFEVLPIWMIIVKIFLIFLSLIKSRLLDLLILGQIIGLIVYLINYFFHPFYLTRNRSLMLRPKNELYLPEHQLVKYSHK